MYDSFNYAYIKFLDTFSNNFIWVYIVLQLTYTYNTYIVIKISWKYPHLSNFDKALKAHITTTCLQLPATYKTYRLVRKKEAETYTRCSSRHISYLIEQLFHD